MKDSHIQWTDNTFNPWMGCTKVSPGCLNCYAETLMDKRYGKVSWGAGKPRNRTSPDNWREPKRWNAAAQKIVEAFNAEEPLTGMEGLNRRPPRRPRVFCSSLADWLDAEAPIDWLADLLVLIFDCGFLDWQLLSKRPENFRNRLIAASIFIRHYGDPTERNHAIRGWIDGWIDGTPPHNVWLGVSVEDQLRLDVRIPTLVATAAVVRFLSCEPLLGRLEFSNATGRADGVAILGKPALEGIHWVIVGGESGFSGVRKLDVSWVEGIVNQCRTLGVAVFVKQLGARPFTSFDPTPAGVRSFRDQNMDSPPRWEWVWQLKHPKGGDPSEWPERLRVAEFPEVGA